MRKCLTVFLVLLVACGSLFAGGAKEPKEGEKKTMTFAVIPLSLGHPWWVRCEEGARKAEKDLGIKIIFTAPDKEDAAKQIDVFNDMVNKKVDAIVFTAVDVEAAKKPVADARAKGIPVFGFDVGAPGCDLLWTASGWAPPTSGKNIGEGVAKEIGYKGEVAILTGGLGSPFLAKRQKAIEEAFAKYPDIKVVGVYANDNDYGKALQQCESILQAYPNLKGFASCVNTGVTAAGKAVENANLSGKVAIWGTSSPSESREYVKRGTVKGALALDSAQMTYLGILMAYNYITKDKVLPKPGDEFGWAGKPYTDEAEKFSYVEDTLLTPENVDSFKF
jgi:ABC-type sugar transport system substrate-binding protein